MGTLLKKIQNLLSMNTMLNLETAQASWFLACAVLLVSSSFIVGYFWGKQNSAERLQSSITREAFADQIYNSLCVACSGDTCQEESETSAEADYDENSETEQAELQDSETTVAACDSNAGNAVQVHTQYYAQLAGYTSLKRAEAFAERATQKHIPVLIKERTSTSPKGRVAIWYQVVTEPYEDQDALNSIVAILKKEEKLHDVKIVQG